MALKKRARNNKGILLLAFLVFAVVLGALVFRKYETATHKVEPAPAAAPVGTVVATLFFASADGQGLVREGREVEVEETVEDGIESVVEELIRGPLGSLAPTVPNNLRVLGVQVKGDVAQIDFGREFSEAIPHGSSAEMAAVYSIVDTVSTNFPAIKSVRFLVEGQPVSDPDGHLDLTAPLPADYSLEKKPQPS
jgi:spore germination protein GerM